MSKQNNISFHLEKPLRELMTPEAKEFLLSEWYRKMFPYIPFVTGTLASTIASSEAPISPADAMLLGLDGIKQTKTYIHFKVPYASTQYEGVNFNFTKDLHPLAQAYWAQVAADLHGEQIINDTKKYIIKRSKNK